MKINSKGLDIIKKFEGLRLSAYLCPAGVLTIGYGTTAGVKKDMTITEAEASKMLSDHLEKIERQISALVAPKLTENEFSALCSLVYNIGIGNFEKSSLLKKLNKNEKRENVAEEFLKWRMAAGKVLKGLEKRRAAEKELFLS